MSVCCLLLMLVVAAAVTAAERHAGHCVPSCAQLLPQMAGAVHWCSTRPFSDKAIVDTVVDCVVPDAPDKISATAPANVNNKMVVASSFRYEDIARSDTKWTECKAERLEDGSEVSFGAVWNASEGFCPGRYAIWLATYDVQSCWLSDELWLSDYFDAENEDTIDQKKAASLPKAETYRCERCSFVNTENSVEGSKVSAGKRHTYVITNNGSPMVFRYLSCDESKAQTFPILEAVNVKEFTCKDCRQWIDLVPKKIYNCQAGKIGQDEFRDKSICEEDRLPPTMWPPTKETTVQTTTTMQPTTTTMQPTTTTMQQTTATVQPTTTTMQPATTTMQQTTATMQPKTVTMQQTTTTMQQTTITVQPTTNTVQPTTTAMQPTTTTTQPTTTTTLPTTTTTQPTTTTMQPTTTTMQQTTTTMSMERATSLMGKQTPHFTTQPPSSSGSNYVEPNANDTLANYIDGTTETRDVIQEALEQLKSPKFEDDALRNPDNMLLNLETVVTSSKNLSQKEVSQALEGFERFTKTILQNFTSGNQNVKKKLKNFTLVVASEAIGALVSDSGEKIELIQREQNWTVEEVLAQTVSVGVLLHVGRAASATGIAVTVLPHDSVAAAVSERGLHVNSDVVSVQVANSSSVNHVDIFLKPRVGYVRRRCGMWDLSAKKWNFSSCTLYYRSQAMDVCRCWHLTHFAEIMTDADLQWGVHARPLEALSLAGVFASLLGALGLAVTAAVARRWCRKPGTRVLLQLGSAVAARDLLMAVITVDAFRPSWLGRAGDTNACPLLGVALHYALLAAAAWTTTAAVLQLLRLSTVTGAQAVFPHVVLVCSVCSWLLPLVPVVTLVATSGLKDGYPLRNDSATDYLCYPRGVALYATVVFPVALCTAINAAIFLYLLLAVLFPMRLGGTVVAIRKHGSVNLRRRVLTAVVLFFLLGLPWLLGPPARVPVVAYLFCLVATPQGMALFVFFALCNGEARSSLWAAVTSIVPSTSSSGRSAEGKRITVATSNTRDHDSTSEHAPAVGQQLHRHLRDHLQLALHKLGDKSSKATERNTTHQHNRETDTYKTF